MPFPGKMNYMLGPLLNTLAQQIGPKLQQLLQAAAPYARRIPPPAYLMAARCLSKEVSNWYNSLSPEAQKKIDNAIYWVVKDLTSDAIEAYTGIPVRPLVNKVMDSLQEHQGNPEAEKYVSARITQQLEELLG